VPRGTQRLALSRVRAPCTPWVSDTLCHRGLSRLLPSRIRAQRAPCITGTVCLCDPWRLSPSRVRAPRAPACQALSAAVIQALCAIASSGLRGPEWRTPCASAASGALRVRGFGRFALLGFQALCAAWRLKALFFLNLCGFGRCARFGFQALCATADSTALRLLGSAPRALALSRWVPLQVWARRATWASGAMCCWGLRCSAPHESGRRAPRGCRH
jgi:hypothetical protein